jgi:hypothetical protein
MIDSEVTANAIFGRLCTKVEFEIRFPCEPSLYHVRLTTYTVVVRDKP